MRHLLRAAAALTVLATAAPARADDVIATVDRPTPISAYGSGLLWSARDPATGRYRLMYTQALMPPAPLPGVRERSVPFDADLGPGPHGHFLAVYSRCEREPAYDPIDAAGPPDYTLGRGCDLYQYDLSSRVEKRLVNASSPTASEVLPTVWKDRIAFARIYDGSGPQTYLYERPRTTGGASRRMPAGTPGTGKLRARPTSLELYGRRLAFAWLYSSGQALGPGSQLRLDDTQTKAVTTIDDTTGGGLTTIERASPEFNTSQLYYARLCKGDPGGCPGRAALVRVRYSTGDTATAPIGAADLAMAVGNRSQEETTVYLLRDSSPYRACFVVGQSPGVPTCSIVATTPDYRPAD